MANILLIEPDRQLAETYKQALETSGHTVVPVSGAQAAVFAADTAKPDCVVLELQLIGHSGIEFLYEFRSYPDWQNVPVILHTQVPRREFDGSWQLLAEQLGIVHYLYKPETDLRRFMRIVGETSEANNLPVAPSPPTASAAGALRPA